MAGCRVRLATAFNNGNKANVRYKGTMGTTADKSRQAMKIGDLFGLAALIAFLAALGVLGYQGYNWVRHGLWPPISLQFVLGNLGVNLVRIYFPTDWVGAAKVAQWLLNLPFAVWLLASAALFTNISIRQQDSVSRLNQS